MTTATLTRNSATMQETTAPNPTLNRWTAALTLLQFIAMLVTLATLSAALNWPASLDFPATQLLPLISEQRGAVLLGYSAYMLSAFLLVPVALLLRRIMRERDGALLTIAAAIGVVGGVLKILGLTRWLLVMPFLSDTYVNPATDATTRNTIAVVFDALNRWGGGIGENLGVMLFTGVWTALVAVALLRSPRFPAWLGWFGLASAALSLVGFVEVYGLSVGPLLTFGAAVWQIWLVALAGVLLFSRRAAATGA